MLTRYQPELDLLLRTAVWNYSVRTQLATFGQQLLFVCYNPDQLTRTRLVLHFVTSVFVQYLRDVATFRASHIEWLQNTTNWTDSALGVGHFVNFFRFLSTGKKPSLVDWMLRLDHISMHGNRRRDVGYTNMTRELIWGGFMVKLLVLYCTYIKNYKHYLQPRTHPGIARIYFAADQLPFRKAAAAQYGEFF